MLLTRDIYIVLHSLYNWLKYLNLIKLKKMKKRMQIQGKVNEIYISNLRKKDFVVASRVTNNTMKFLWVQFFSNEYALTVVSA